MIEIPKEVEEEVSAIVDHLLEYDNKDKLSWTNVYKKVLNELNIEDSNLLLSSSVKEITNRGYDIIAEPFRLERFK